MNDIKEYPKRFVTNKGKKVIIRLPEIGDFDQLHGYINELVDEDTTIMRNQKVSQKEERDYLSGILEAVKENEGFNLLAFNGGKLVANVSVERKQYRQKHLGVLGIAIIKDFRNEGLGTELLKQAIILSNNFLKLKILVLSTFSTNKRAIHLYREMGFKKCGGWPKGVFYKGKYIDDNFMYLNLDHAKLVLTSSTARRQN